MYVIYGVVVAVHDVDAKTPYLQLLEDTALHKCDDIQHDQFFPVKKLRNKDVQEWR